MATNFESSPARMLKQDYLTPGASPQLTTVAKFMFSYAYNQTFEDRY